MLDTRSRQADLQGAIRDAEEEIFLLRCALRCLLEEGEERRLTSLWRLADYLEQHINDIRQLCQ